MRRRARLPPPLRRPALHISTCAATAAGPATILNMQPTHLLLVANYLHANTGCVHNATPENTNAETANGLPFVDGRRVECLLGEEMAKVEPHLIHGTDVGLRAKLAESAFPRTAKSVSAWQPPGKACPQEPSCSWPAPLIRAPTLTWEPLQSSLPRSTKNVRPLKTSTRVSLTKIDGVKRMPVRCST